MQHEVVNGSAAPVTPQLYLQLVRDGNPPPGESSFYFTFTGPAVYTDAAKFQKIDFKRHREGQGRATPTRTRRQRLGRDGPALLRRGLADRRRTRPREFFTGRSTTNLYSVGMLVPLGEIAPGASKALDAQLFAGPQEENKLAALAPGLELVKDYGWFTILAKPLFWLLTSCTSCSATGAGRSSRWSCC